MINQYTKESIAVEAQYKQESDPEKPMNLLEAAVSNQNRVVGAQFGFDEPLTVCLKYESNATGTRLLCGH